MSFIPILLLHILISTSIFPNVLEKELLKSMNAILSLTGTLRERERVGRFGRMALKHVKYHV